MLVREVAWLRSRVLSLLAWVSLLRKAEFPMVSTLLGMVIEGMSLYAKACSPMVFRFEDRWMSAIFVL